MSVQPFYTVMHQIDLYILYNTLHTLHFYKKCTCLPRTFYQVYLFLWIHHIRPGYALIGACMPFHMTSHQMTMNMTHEHQSNTNWIELSSRITKSIFPSCFPNLKSYMSHFNFYFFFLPVRLLHFSKVSTESENIIL